MEQTATASSDFAFDIVHQENYSRGELLLRSFFGFIYMVIPHMFLLFFMSIASFVLGFISWWVVLFTSQYPRAFFDFQVAMLRWNTRLTARIFNLSDGYPAFGTSAEDQKITVNVLYPNTLDRGILLLRFFFGFIYVMIPHAFCLFFRMIGMYFVMFIAWWAVLFTGKYPKGMHDFVVGTLRWATRVNVYMSFLTDKYPPFSGR
jgi:hypothetical protein